MFSIKTEDTGISDKISDHSNRKIFTSKLTLERLPIVLTLVKARNVSENLLCKIRTFIYSLYQGKEITKKVYNNIMNSIKL